jgi:hypothetical protein
VNHPMFDLALIARLAKGRESWRRCTGLILLQDSDNDAAAANKSRTYHPHPGATMADTLKDMPFKAVQVDALVCALSAIPPLRSPTTALCALFIAILGTAAADDDDGV